MSILDRIGAFTQTEAGKALDLAHRTYQERMEVHSHSGRALVETIGEVCRNHPNLVGIAAGLLVEQILVHERHVYEEHHHPGLAAPSAAHVRHLPPDHPDARAHQRAIRLAHVRPGKLAFEVFAAIIALKFAHAMSRIFRRKHHRDVWFGRIARIHLWSATFATFHGAKAIKSHKVSAWRNAWFALFATDAIKPLLKPTKEERAYAAAMASLPAAAAPAAQHDPFKLESASPAYHGAGHAPAPAYEGHHAEPPADAHDGGRSAHEDHDDHAHGREPEPVVL